MAEAQFKCPETQPTPARAEQGRGNGAAPLPRGLARTRTYAAGLGGLTRRTGAQEEAGGVAGARTHAGPRRHVRQPGGRVPVRACADGEAARPAAVAVMELGARAPWAGNQGRRPTQSLWSPGTNTGTAAPRRRHVGLAGPRPRPLVSIGTFWGVKYVYWSAGFVAVSCRQGDETAFSALAAHPSYKHGCNP